MPLFVGRKKELGLLNDLRDKRTASLVVVYGRRRIGKSRLIEQFAKDNKMIAFSGLPTQSHTTQQSQLDEFTRQMAAQLPIKLPIKQEKFTDWMAVFDELAQHIKTDRVILFFDEISWIGSCDPDFLGKLKNAWDMKFKQNDQLIVVLCGSVSLWINKNILANTGFYGRISLKIQLDELLLSECSTLLNTGAALMSAFEQLKILAVTGGIPKYLEEINPKLSAEENIKRLCFLPSGLLFNDYDYIFSALLQRESEYYEKIILLLQDSCLDQKEIANRLGLESGGMISDLTNELVVSGFISRDYTWNIKNGDISTRLSQYRLSDNYLRFYLRYINPNLQKIIHNQFVDHSLNALPGWSSIMGLQIENLVLNNRQAIKEKLGIYPDEVVYDNPFFQKKTARQKGCQIDYMVQTKYDLYVCEIKFSRNMIGSSVIDAVKSKIDSITFPKNFSVRPVLIHASEVSDAIIDSHYFSKIIDIRDLIAET